MFNLYALKKYDAPTFTESFTDAGQPGQTLRVALKPVIGFMDRDRVDDHGKELIEQHVTGKVDAYGNLLPGQSKPNGIFLPIGEMGEMVGPILPTEYGCKSIAQLMAMQVATDDLALLKFEEWCGISHVMPYAFANIVNWSGALYRSIYGIVGGADEAKNEQAESMEPASTSASATAPDTTLQ